MWTSQPVQRKASTIRNDILQPEKNADFSENKKSFQYICKTCD